MKLKNKSNNIKETIFLDVVSTKVHEEIGSGLWGKIYYQVGRTELAQILELDIIQSIKQSFNERNILLK